MSVKVVVAVGNRKIERCIARMEAIDVLTTVRKREAVLDAKGFLLMVWKAEICL